MAEPTTASGDAGDGPYAGYWRRAVGLAGTVDPTHAAVAVERLSDRLGWSLARAPVVDLVPETAAEIPEAAFRRLAQARQAATLAALRARGVSVLPIKGHDSARLYEPPWKRLIGDLDLLVRPADAAALVRELEDLGFSVEPSPQGALGVTSDVSFHPMVSGDGVVSVDIHTALDAYPLSAALTAEAVFADAVDGPSGPRLAPHHAAAAAVSNMAKERFGAYAVRHLMDIGRLALREAVDWPEVDRLAAAAGLGPARATALGALRRIGVPAEFLPRGIDPGFGPAVRLARALGHLRLEDPGRFAKVGREIAWCYAPGTIARIWWFRLNGVLKPRTGIPPGAAAPGGGVP